MEKFATNIFWIWPFSDQAEPKKSILTTFSQTSPKIFPPNKFLIFQWKSINYISISSQLSGKFAIWPFRGKTSYLILAIFQLVKILCFNNWFLFYTIGVIVLGLDLFDWPKFSGSGYFLILHRPEYCQKTLIFPLKHHSMMFQLPQNN